MRRSYNIPGGTMTVTQYIASKGYTTCEYIKGDGKAYINLSYGGAFRCDCEAINWDRTAEYMIIGAHALTSPYGRNFISFSYGANRRSQFQCGICGYASYGEQTIGQRHRIEFQSLLTNNYLKVDGTTLRQATTRISTSDGGTALTTNNLALWANDYEKMYASSWGKHALCWMKVWNPTSNVMLYRMYPCYSGSQIGLYDIVNDRFRGNDNTRGAFTKGSDYNFTEEL